MGVYTGTPVLRDNYKGLGLGGIKYSYQEVTITLSSQGGATNNIPAAKFSLSAIKGCTAAIKSDNTVLLPASPSYDGALLLLGGGASNAPADYSGDFRITVWGTPL